jgi:hypothetical protein
MGVFSLSFSPDLAGVDGTFKGRAEEGIPDREMAEARPGPAQFIGHQLWIIISANNTFVKNIRRDHMESFLLQALLSS